ncbi:MAG TPA: hypothetical protein DCQ12_02295 [Candidatus Cloacimonas sp.]|nr:hypothetical protein [Candidatus Cloacimonas sp.]
MHTNGGGGEREGGRKAGASFGDADGWQGCDLLLGKAMICGWVGQWMLAVLLIVSQVFAYI